MAATMPNFTSILIFGDSMVEPGITTSFSNGKLIPDFVARFLGIKETVPPSLAPNLTNDDIRTGVNFASAGSGYDDLTTVPTGVIPVSKQLGMFKSYIAKLSNIVGNTEAKSIIQKSFVVLSAGTNDFGLNYFLLPARRAQFNVSSYQDFLQKSLQDFVKGLYDLGVRTIAIAGLPPMGCLPLLVTERLKDPLDRTYLEDENEAARSYNQKLVKLIPQLQASLPGSKIVYADVYTPLNDMLNNPQKYGFTTTDRGCCGAGILEASFSCNPHTPVCPTPSQFLFWDSIHPSEAAYKALVDFLEKQIIQSFQ
ncbi:hypothetical protein PTKIN_Ptkin11bG0003000 [Pterospermum kingtungense]